MSQILRQSTQVIVRIGPAVAVGDGFTPVTSLTLAGADEAELLKANTTTTTDISGATMAAITGCDGWYGLTLTTSHTDTVGCLDVMINDDSLILPIYARFQVIEEAAYDAIYAASADPKADINVATIDNNAITAAAIATGAIDADAIADNAIDAGAIASDAITAAKIATGAITAAKFAAGAIDAAAIADNAIDAGAIASNAITSAKIAADAIGASQIADNAIDAGAIAADAITAAKIANGAIDAATFAADVDAEILSYIVDDATRIDASALNTASVTTVPAINAKTTNLPAAPASTTNITAGTITTVTNLTNAPTSGDFTATMKTSIGTAVAASAVASVTGNVGGNVTGSVGSVVAEVDADVKKINGTTVNGDGAGTPWGP